MMMMMMMMTMMMIITIITMMMLAVVMMMMMIITVKKATRRWICYLHGLEEETQGHPVWGVLKTSRVHDQDHVSLRVVAT